MKEQFEVRLDQTQTGSMVLPVGWGVEFVEGTNWDTVVYLIVLVALSLSVGISWSRKKGDVQGWVCHWSLCVDASDTCIGTFFRSG
jgi:hypothetical protein